MKRRHQVCLFLTAWTIFTLHFATDVVREHYPAFALIENANLCVDDYQGLHSDIFVHTDGHSYVGNNVATSVVAAGPLGLFKPLLDRLDDYGKQHIDSNTVEGEWDYRIDDRPVSKQFFAEARARGIHLRLGAATVITSAFLMAPLSALCVVLMYSILRVRGAGETPAITFSLLFAFATPMLFRSAILNNNMFVMYASFLAFYLLWIRSEDVNRVSLRRRVAAGALGGLSLAFDYSGIVPLLVLYGYLLIARIPSAGFWRSLRESAAYILGSVPPVGFLLWSQWEMYGNPFLPGQYWMPDVNYTDVGWRGLSWPSADVMWQNLFNPSYGIYVFGPLLAIGLIPAWRYSKETLLVPRAERRAIAAFVAVFMLFCAANRYSLMQFNSGFRYLAPLMPFVFLTMCDHLIRIPRICVFAIATPVLVHSWVIAAVRRPVPESWRRITDEGVQLPWLAVLRQTRPERESMYYGPLTSILILGISFLLIGAMWYFCNRSRSQQQSGGPASSTPADGWA